MLSSGTFGMMTKCHLQFAKERTFFEHLIVHSGELTSNIDHLINVDTESDVLSLINEHDLEGIVDIEERCNDCEVTAESTIEDMKIIINPGFALLA